MRGNTVAVAVAIVAGWGLAFGIPRDFTVGHFVDDAQYALLAKSLRERLEYRNLNLPDELAETKFPPLFPAVLAAVWSPARDDLENVDRLRYVNLVLLGPLAGALAMMGIVALKLPPAPAVGAALAGLATSDTTALWVIPLSEPLFLLLLAIGITLLAARRGLAGAVTLALATYARTVGIVFLAAVLIVRWRRREPGVRREAALAAGVLAPWLLWQAVHAGTVPPALSGYYGSYGLFYLSSLGADWLTVAGRVPLHNVGYVLASLGTPLVGGDWLPHGLVLAAGAVLVGACVRARPVHEGVVLGVVFYLAVTTAWPFPPDRLVAGVLPILILVAAAGAGRWRWVPVTFAGIVATVGLVTGEALDRHRKRAAAATRLAAEVRPIVPATGTLATSNPALHYLAFGVPTVPNQRMRSYRAYRLGYWATAWGLGDDLWAIVDRYHPGAVLVERRGVEGRYAAGSLKRQCPALFEPLWESTDGIEFLWKVRPNTACAPEQTRL